MIKREELNQLREKFYELYLYSNINIKHIEKGKLSGADADVFCEIGNKFSDECKEIDEDPYNKNNYYKGASESLEFVLDNWDI